MKIFVIASLMILPASTALAQTVKTPSSTNAAGGLALHSAGAAASAIPAAHEVPAQVVVPTAPAAQPFVSGVTAAGADLSNGLTGTGNNVSKSGVSVNPTNSAKPEHVQAMGAAAKNAASRAASAVPSEKDAQCAAVDLATGECQ